MKFDLSSFTKKDLSKHKENDLRLNLIKLFYLSDKQEGLEFISSLYVKRYFFKGNIKKEDSRLSKELDNLIRKSEDYTEFKALYNRIINAINSNKISFVDIVDKKLKIYFNDFKGLHNQITPLKDFKHILNGFYEN
ncbi:MAG: hypothetical protein [Caudoviricetes sp.]|nr:MAG: hypothetical protein [Caudoviricetes sp.]